MWAFARMELGLSTDEFWCLTHKQFYLLAERFWSKMKRDHEGRQWLAAMICASIYEVNRDSKKRRKPYSPADFMSGKKRKKQTPEEMLAVVQAMQRR